MTGDSPGPWRLRPRRIPRVESLQVLGDFVHESQFSNALETSSRGRVANYHQVIIRQSGQTGPRPVTHDSRFCNALQNCSPVTSVTSNTSAAFVTSVPLVTSVTLSCRDAEIDWGTTIFVSYRACWHSNTIPLAITKSI